MIHIYHACFYPWDTIRADILKVENECFDDTQSFEEEDFEGFCNNVFNFVAVEDHRVIGYVAAEELVLDDEVLNDYGALAFGRNIHLGSIAISKDYRGKGLADELIRKVKQMTELWKYQCILLDATNPSIIKCAERNGFVKVKYFKEWGDRGVTSWLMKWEVDDNDCRTK